MPSVDPARRAATSLVNSCIFMRPDGPMEVLDKTPAALGRASDAGQPKAARILAMFEAQRPEDVHYPMWEKHLEGDELLILLSGEVSLELRDEYHTWTAALHPDCVFVVPAGVWHRLILRAPSRLIAITPRQNSVHSELP